MELPPCAKLDSIGQQWARSGSFLFRSATRCCRPRLSREIRVTARRLIGQEQLSSVSGHAPAGCGLCAFLPLISGTRRGVCILRPCSRRP
ncbi:hypothetical protein J2W35_004777 [Variovorax boronicumulans]|nr:hypothetical protein [Variovorax boronicumulans]